MRLTANETLELSSLHQGFRLANASAEIAAKDFTQGISELLSSGDSNNLHRALSGIEQIKKIFQRMHNYCHTIGMLAAKEFLEKEFPDLPWEAIDVTQKPNENGPDFRIPKYLIVAELKTIEPCGGSKFGDSPVKFGSDQQKKIKKDLQKLSAPENDGFNKYMFVTSALAYHCLNRDYREKFPGVCFVRLSDIPTVSRPTDVAESQLQSKFSP